ncbi:glycosyltransferase family 4 protein [Patescibacteria group bacterium]|nr:glycosyltransferase family 4 protein [Patescibacteria group bacterium]
MKVLLVNKFHFLKGGSERVYFETGSLLEKKGHQVIYFSMKDKRNVYSPQEKYFVENVDFTSRKNWLRKSFRYIYYKKAAENLERLILAEKPDIAHLHNISHHITPAILKTLKKYGIPVVQTLHDYQIICPNYRLFTEGAVCERCKKRKYYNCVLHRCIQNGFAPSVLGAKELYFQWFFKFYREKVDLFICPSGFLQTKLKDWGVKQKTKVVPNFIDLENFEPNYTVGDYIVCVSRLSAEKGIMDLLEAVRALPEVKLKLVGDGPMRAEVLDYLKKNNVKNVEYAGAKFDEELKEVIRKSRFAIIPSEWYENYPLIALESMALGKPVLSAKIGGLAGMIAENFNGWFFESSDVNDLQSKLSLHYNEIERIEELGKNARRTVEEKNSAEKYYQEISACYDIVLKNEMDNG